MYDELIKSLRDCAEVNSLSLYKRGLMKQSADAIEELSKPRWIPVTERLPENERETYLILTDGRYECDARWTDNVYGLGQSDRWGWCIFDIPQYSKVTHWMPRMPLPEPPKEE